ERRAQPFAAVVAQMLEQRGDAGLGARQRLPEHALDLDEVSGNRTVDVPRRADRLGGDGQGRGHAASIADRAPSVRLSEVSNLIEYYVPGGAESIAALKSTAAATAFLFQADPLDGHGAIDGLAHVIDREGGHADSGQRLHLDAGAA